MDKKITIYLFSGVLSFFAFTFLINSQKVGLDIFKGLNVPEQEREKEANEAKQRAEYENMMLRSPKTGKIPDDIRAAELAFSSKIITSEAYALSKTNGSVYSANWTFRGPINQGGRTRALEFDIANENILLAGGISGGMWRSTDQGTTWKKTTSPADIQSVTCLAQDVRTGKTNTWYYGTGEGAGNSASGGGNNAQYRGDGLFKSTDNGLTWTRLPATVKNKPNINNPFSYVWNVAVDPADKTNDVVYASVRRAVYRSSDGGTTWNEVLGSFATNTSYYSDVAVASNGVVYAALSGDGKVKGIFRSSNGVNWKQITPAGFASVFERIVIGISPSNPEIVYFLAYTPGTGAVNHSLWKYTDDGNGTGTWVDRTENVPQLGGTNNVGNFDSQEGYDLIVKVKPDNPEVVFIGGTNLYRSTDGFATPISNKDWIGGYINTGASYENYANHHADQHALTFSPKNPLVMFSGMDGGVAKTSNCLDDNLVWENKSNGYTTSQFYSVAIDRGTPGSYVMVGGLQDNGHLGTMTGKPNEPWTVLPFGGDGCFTALTNGISKGTGSIYICTQNGELMRVSLLSGGQNSWTTIKPAGASRFMFVTPYLLDPNNSNVMYLAEGDSIWMNSNLSEIPDFSNDPTSVNWSRLKNAYVQAANVTALGVSTSPANVLYYGSAGGEVYRMDNANTGTAADIDVWSGKGFPAGAYVSCIAVDPSNANNAMVVFSNYDVVSLFYTTNGGTSWTPVAGNLEENPDGSGSGPSCRWATILPYNGKTYFFVATSTGVYSTDNLNGSSTVWTKESASEIGNSVVTMIVSRPSDGVIVAATHAGGIYSAEINVTGVKDNFASPASFNLSQNYPNPFNPSTTIDYKVPYSTNVSLKVYDQRGREAAVLVNEYKPAGSYSIRFNASKLASGVYFYNLKAGSYNTTKKLTLLK